MPRSVPAPPEDPGISEFTERTPPSRSGLPGDGASGSCQQPNRVGFYASQKSASGKCGRIGNGRCVLQSCTLLLLRYGSPAATAAVVKRCAPLMKTQGHSLADLYVAA